MRRACSAALLLCSLAAALLVAQGRTLAQEEPNPFVTRGGIPTPAQQASPAEAAAEGAAAIAPAPAATTAPLPEAAAPAPAPAGAPGPGTEGATADAAAAGPCACTSTGLSGGTNTSRIGCAQHDLVSGSNRLTCYVNVGAAQPPAAAPAVGAAGRPYCRWLCWGAASAATDSCAWTTQRAVVPPCTCMHPFPPQDPAACTNPPSELTQSNDLRGAASRACTQQEAAPLLPTVSRLIVGTPQVGCWCGRGPPPQVADCQHACLTAHLPAAVPFGSLAQAPTLPLLPCTRACLLAHPALQLVSFANALRQANLSSIPGQQVTSGCCRRLCCRRLLLLLLPPQQPLFGTACLTRNCLPSPPSVLLLWLACPG